MPKKSSYVIGAAAAAVLTVGAGAAAAATIGANTDPAPEQKAESVYTDAHRSDAAVSQARTERLAQKARPGSVVESHLETEGDGLRWEVKTDDGQHVWEVQVDPSNGDIIGNQPDE